MIYTKTGDKGSTSLVGGSRVKKSHCRVEAYGTVDELNSHVGLLAAMIDNLSLESATEASTLVNQLGQIQDRLFVIQTILATEDDEILKKLPPLPPNAVKELEDWIDSMDARLPKHNRFVIPGESMASAQAHVSRTVCRRTEREIVRLSDEAHVDENVQSYINRLSDYLFVLARFILLVENKKEIFWNNI